MSSLGH